MTYSEKLKHPKWQKKRLEILSRDNFKCCLCGDEETELHVHHLKYTDEPYDAPNQYLETLCKDCHFLKTNFQKEHGVFIKALKTKDCILTLNIKKEVHIFMSLDNVKLQHVLGIPENSVTFYILLDFCKENWNEKKH